jgi:AraC-like DNA-binding protein
MLRYLAYGERVYRDRPVRPDRRDRWEFEGALRGRIAPVIPGWPAEPPRERRLWLLPPHHGHGWTGDGAPALIVAFKPLVVPEAIERSVARAERAGALLHWDMTPADAAWLAAEIEALLPSYSHPNAIDLLCQSRLVIEVAIRALAAQPAHMVEPPANDPGRMIDSALAWFDEHLSEGVGEDEVAHAAHCSPAHLRRIFHRVLGEGPRTVLSRRRLDRAERLLVSTELPLSQVAEACGFAAASTFCRAYQRERGRPPGAVRSEKPLFNYVSPAPAP